MSDVDVRWWELAACQGARPQQFDLGEYVNVLMRGRDQALAAQPVIQRFCSGCVVATDCLADAHRHGDTGIRGGVLLTREHGTLSTYRWHLRQGEAACSPCRDAAAAYSRDAKRAQRLEVAAP